MTRMVSCNSRFAVRLAGTAALVVAASMLLGGTRAEAQLPGLGRGANGPGSSRGLGIGSYDKPRTTPVYRVVQGTVLDKDGAAVKGAIVHLTDDKKNLRSMTTDEKGTYRFTQLSRTMDYKLWAQAKDKKSPEKVISSFDTKDELTRDLKIE